MWSSLKNKYIGRPFNCWVYPRSILKDQSHWVSVSDIPKWLIWVSVVRYPRFPEQIPLWLQQGLQAWHPLRAAGEKRVCVWKIREIHPQGVWEQAGTKSLCQVTDVRFSAFFNKLGNLPHWWIILLSLHPLITPPRICLCKERLWPNSHHFSLRSKMWEWDNFWLGRFSKGINSTASKLSFQRKLQFS